MLDIYNIKKTLEQINENTINLEKSLNIQNLKLEIKDIDSQMDKPNFWAEQDKANKTILKLKDIKNKVENIEKLKTNISNLQEEIELYQEQEDLELEKEIEHDLKLLEKDYESFEIETLLNGKYDKNNAILTIHPGAGGTESCDWVSMLYRMYLRYAQLQGYKTEILDEELADIAGYKSVSILIKGQNAYGKLKSEHGVHRLVRISPFDSNKRRHTSFASVEVLPEIEQSDEININPDDLKIDYYRASGAGGQHINKTSSAVRITHIPTGIVVTCQTQRSQFQNKDYAMKMLYAKLNKLEQIKKEQNKKELKGDVLDIAWGSQIRSYVFCPYQLVKDNRTKFEVSNIDSVMDGNLDPFIFDYLKNEVNSKGL